MKLRSYAFTLLTLLTLQAPRSDAATINFQLERFTGATNNRPITISLATDPLAQFTNIVFGVPLTLQPTNSRASTNLLAGNYWVKLDQVATPMFMPVPDSTNTYNAIDLIRDGLKHLILKTNYVILDTSSLTNVSLVVTDAVDHVWTFNGIAWQDTTAGGLPQSQFLGNSYTLNLPTYLSGSTGGQLTISENGANTDDLLVIKSNGVQIAWLDSSGLWHGDGAALTNLPASQLTGGPMTITDIHTNATDLAGLVFDVSSDAYKFFGAAITAGPGSVFAGNGIGLTNLPGATNADFAKFVGNISSNQLPASQLIGGPMTITDIHTNTTDLAGLVFDVSSDAYKFFGAAITAGPGAVFAGNGVGLTNLQGATNADFTKFVGDISTNKLPYTAITNSPWATTTQLADATNHTVPASIKSSFCDDVSTNKLPYTAITNSPWATETELADATNHVVPASLLPPTVTTNNGTLTSSRVQVGNGARGVQDATASGSVPIDADGSATTFSQINALAPSMLVTNGDSVGFTNTGNVQSATLNTTSTMSVGGLLTTASGITANGTVAINIGNADSVVGRRNSSATPANTVAWLDLYGTASGLTNIGILFEPNSPQTTGWSNYAGIFSESWSNSPSPTLAVRQGPNSTAAQAGNYASLVASNFTASALITATNGFVTPMPTLAATSNQTNYTVSMLGDAMIYGANTNANLSLTTPAAFASTTVLFNCVTSTVDCIITLPANLLTNINLNLRVTNGWVKALNFYSIDGSSTNILVSDAAQYHR